MAWRNYSPDTLGSRWGPGGDEPLCLQSPVPPFIWGWVILGFPSPPPRGPPIHPKLEKEACVVSTSIFHTATKRTHRYKHHRAGMQYVLIWGRGGGIICQSLSCKLFPRKWGVGINNRLFAAGLAEVASGSNSHPPGQESQEPKRLQISLFYAGLARPPKGAVGARRVWTSGLPGPLVAYATSWKAKHFLGSALKGRGIRDHVGS